MHGNRRGRGAGGGDRDQPRNTHRRTPTRLRRGQRGGAVRMACWSPWRRAALRRTGPAPTAPPTRRPARARALRGVGAWSAAGARRNIRVTAAAHASRLLVSFWKEGGRDARAAHRAPHAVPQVGPAGADPGPADLEP